MKFAICNEVFGDVPFGEACRMAADIGYRGVEVAPFTLMPGHDPADMRELSYEAAHRALDGARSAAVEVVGLHWLLAKTAGMHLTSPDDTVRGETAEYLGTLAMLCKDLGGEVMVLGSPQQRNLPPGISHEQGEAYAAEVIRAAAPKLEELGVTLALEPLGPAEGNFLNTAESAIRLAERVDSPRCRLHLDIKAMASEPTPIVDIIHRSAPWVAHFHANDPNLLGPGMGEVDIPPIMTALKEIGYDGWVSVEPFRYEPTGEAVARKSLENLRAALS